MRRKYRLFRLLIFIFVVYFTFPLFQRQKIYPSVQRQTLSNVTYDHRSFIINGQRKLLIVGAIHYPRSSPGMWPHLLRKTKDAGINAIDTYVFWNLHEPREGHYDFETGYANLPLFLKLAKDHGLYVILRIGPYVCAEWNLGGIPSWLLNKPGMVFRTWNTPFMTLMEGFLRKSMEVVRPHLASSGGPIIAMQMENEYGNVQKEYGLNGDKYIAWAADLANSLDTGVPWFMCQQNNLDTVILTCNGFYCHKWINAHWRYAYETPPMFTELWTGWFQHWATPKLTRPSEDLAFSVTLWFAKGGSFMTYYMWHGGTNFARWGGDFKVTSYDYDAPLNEYGFETHKYYHLALLHDVLNNNSDVILKNNPKNIKYGWYQVINLSKNKEAFIYGDLESPNTVVFLINTDSKRDASIILKNQKFSVPKWTALILIKGSDLLLHQVFSSSAIVPRSSFHMEPSLSHLRVKTISDSIEWIREPIGIWEKSLTYTFERPLEQIRFTNDETDYLWYNRKNLKLPIEADENLVLTIRPPTDLVYVYINGKRAHGNETVVMNVNMDQQGEKINDFATKVVLKPTNFSNSTFDLSILSITMGLLNYGAFYDSVQKGLHGSIMINDYDITEGSWTHQSGLKGEYLEYYKNASDHKWQKLDVGALNVPLIWYKITIQTHEISDLISKSRRDPQKLESYALFLGTMGKGSFWISSRGKSYHVGRYWDVDSESTDCQNCEWSGPFFATKCPIDCKGPSQSYYHIPRDFIEGETASSTPVEIIILEERGGDPSGVQLVLLK